MKSFYLNMLRYREAFNNANPYGCALGLQIPGLNKWFIESEITREKEVIILHNPAWWFGNDASFITVELKAALENAMRKCGIVPKDGEYEIRINPGKDELTGDPEHSIVYVLPDVGLAEKYEEFLLALRQALVAEEKVRKDGVNLVAKY